MIARITKGYAQGSVIAPPSKSMAHRILICTGLANGKSIVENISLSQDVSATLDCLKACGAKYEISGNSVEIEGIDVDNFSVVSQADCRESGSTLRFFVPIFMLCDKPVTLTGSKYLFTRPLDVYKKIAVQQNLQFELTENRLTVCGKITAGEYKVRGDISSQFISGLMFALPTLKGDSVIKLIPPVESRSYINMTMEALMLFGVSATWVDDFTIFIKSNQRYRPCTVVTEGDYSNAAFFAALGSMGNNVEINGLKTDSLQGDKVIFDLLKKLDTQDAVIDVSDCPDIAPILITVAAAKHGARFTGTKRLKIKESDRGTAIAQELAKFGADIKVLENEIVVGNTELHAPSGILNGHNDHRIVMSLAVLLTAFSGEIDGCEAVNKSFPDFFKQLSALGIEVDLYESKNKQG